MPPEGTRRRFTAERWFTRDKASRLPNGCSLNVIRILRANRKTLRMESVTTARIRSELAVVKDYAKVGTISELWEYRELFYFLAWRDMKVRYKQTVLGVLWAIIQPLFTMVIFTIVFGQIANISSE